MNLNGMYAHRKDIRCLINEKPCSQAFKNFINQYYVPFAKDVSFIFFFIDTFYFKYFEMWQAIEMFFLIGFCVWRYFFDSLFLFFFYFVYFFGVHSGSRLFMITKSRKKFPMFYRWEHSHGFSPFVYFFVFRNFNF